MKELEILVAVVLVIHVEHPNHLHSRRQTHVGKVHGDTTNWVWRTMSIPAPRRWCRFLGELRPLDDPMPLVAGRLDRRPLVRHGLVAAVHVDVGEVRVDQLALVERRLDSPPVRVGVLIRASDWVDADGLPRFGKALVFLNVHLTPG